MRQRQHSGMSRCACERSIFGNAQFGQRDNQVTTGAVTEDQVELEGSRQTTRNKHTATGT